MDRYYEFASRTRYGFGCIPFLNFSNVNLGEMIDITYGINYCYATGGCFVAWSWRRMMQMTEAVWRRN